jgi:tetratricopeptide (TPR) repeat protein
MLDSLTSWAKGKTTLREIKKYSDDELRAISHIGYFLLMQGKNEEARILFEGLVAIDPRNDFYYRALGVVFQKLGEDDRAVKQYAYAIRLNPGLPHAYVNRAEIYISLGDGPKAERDLRSALERMGPKDEQLSKKAWALLKVAGTSTAHI